MNEAAPSTTAQEVPFIQAATEMLNAFESQAPAIEDLEQAQALAGQIKKTETGYQGPNGKFISRDVAESVLTNADPETWKIDLETTSALKSAVQSVDNGELPVGMKRDFNKGLNEQLKDVKAAAEARLKLDADIRRKEGSQEIESLKNSHDTHFKKGKEIRDKRTKLTDAKVKDDLKTVGEKARNQAIAEQKADLEAAKEAITGDTLERHYRKRQLELKAKEAVDKVADNARDERAAQVEVQGGGFTGLKTVEQQEQAAQKELEKKAWQEHIGVRKAEDTTPSNKLLKGNQGVAYNNDPTAKDMSYKDWLDAGGSLAAKERLKAANLEVSKQDHVQYEADEDEYLPLGGSGDWLAKLRSQGDQASESQPETSTREEARRRLLAAAEKPVLPTSFREAMTASEEEFEGRPNAEFKDKIELAEEWIKSGAMNPELVFAQLVQNLMPHFDRITREKFKEKGLPEPSESDLQRYRERMAEKLRQRLLPKNPEENRDQEQDGSNLTPVIEVEGSKDKQRTRRRRIAAGIALVAVASVAWLGISKISDHKNSSHPTTTSTLLSTTTVPATSVTESTSIALPEPTLPGAGSTSFIESLPVGIKESVIEYPERLVTLSKRVTALVNQGLTGSALNDEILLELQKAVKLQQANS